MTSDPSSARDVRMRGFVRRSTVEQAWAWIDTHALRLPAENVDLSAADCRVLAADVTSRFDVPGFNRSMMDGYAVRADDTLGASAYNRLRLAVIGQSLPGRAFSGSVGPGQAVRIMTGACMPPGADSVLPVEQSEVCAEDIVALGELSPGKHVGLRGEDVATGAIILQTGRKLRPQDLGLLSSVGIGRVDVVRQPRVRVVATGNELLPSGTGPSGCRIADANGPMLAALVRRDGGIECRPGIVPDDPAAIRAALTQEADVVLVSGGSSVGQEDHAPQVLAELGHLAIHGIAMRPSSPAGMGRIGPRLVFLLPGNPVSCLSAYDFFAGRAIRLLGGRSSQWPYRVVRRPLRRKLVSTVGRVDYARVKLIDESVEPLAISGASVLSSTTRADGFVVIPSDQEGYPAGEEVDVCLYD